MNLSKVLPRLSRRPRQMAIIVHLPPRSSLFHVSWPRLTPGYTGAFHENAGDEPFRARVHKGCTMCVRRNVDTHALPAWQPQVGKYATLSQGHRGLHRHKRTFISTHRATHLPRGRRGERSTHIISRAYVWVRICEFATARYIYFAQNFIQQMCSFANPVI